MGFKKGKKNVMKKQKWFHTTKAKILVAYGTAFAMMLVGMGFLSKNKSEKDIEPTVSLVAPDEFILPQKEDVVEETHPVSSTIESTTNVPLVPVTTETKKQENKSKEELKIENYTNQLEKYRSLSFYVPSFKKRYMDYKMKHEHFTWKKVITYVNIGLDHPFYTHITPIENPSSKLVLVNKYHRLPRNYIPALKSIPASYSTKNIQLEKDACNAFILMVEDGLKNGVSIKAVSGYRSYEYQKNLYDNDSRSVSVKDKKLARPGHSEHQTGLTVDVVSLSESMVQTKEYKWYSKNAHLYGFIIRYPEGKSEITGYNKEPWHLRYVGKDVATFIYQNNITFDEYIALYQPKSKNLYQQWDDSINTIMNYPVPSLESEKEQVRRKKL